MTGLVRRSALGVLRLLAWTAPAVARAKCSLPARRRPPLVHVIGDSHACFFSGIDSIEHPWPQRSCDRLELFRTYWLGPALAYNLPRYGATTRAREKLLTILAYGPVEPRGLVMLSFGEIDCRFHLLRQSERQHRDVSDLTAECVERYLSVVSEVKALGFRPLVWNVVPSGQPLSADEANPEFPHWGTVEQRNAVTRQFNDECTRRLAGTGIPFVSIVDSLRWI